MCINNESCKNTRLTIFGQHWTIYTHWGVEQSHLISMYFEESTSWVRDSISIQTMKCHSFVSWVHAELRLGEIHKSGGRAHTGETGSAETQASSSTGVNQLQLLSVLLADFNTQSRPVATKDPSALFPSILVGHEKHLGHSQLSCRKCVNHAIVICRLFLSCVF